MGSPPHMRGKVGLLLLLRSRSWITPAYAGKSFIVRCSALEVKDHPRICGEKFNALPAELKAKGSPPHMRGKVGLKETQSSASRITPAYAGKSQKRGKNHVKRRDHPRICGEKQHLPAIHRRQEGSPPHMRGKACVLFCCVGGIGITPAYAGKRWNEERITGAFKDHPRICGEKTKKIP